jgi:uncharacterized protein YggL (DUF469 family)
MELDLDKVYELYNVITEDKYRYCNDLTEYNKIVSIMDRMIDSVKAINTIAYNKNEFELVAWINYVDLLLATFEKLSQIYGFSLNQKNSFFTKYHNLANKNDNDYLRFIRAIILPHSLSLDDSKQKEFINKKMTARCPSCHLASKNEFIIKYLIDDLEEQVNYVHICLADIEDYVIDLFKNVEYIIPTIKSCKKKQKTKQMMFANNEKYDTNWNVEQKLVVLKDFLKKYGSIEDQKGITSLASAMETADKILNFDFDKVNQSVIDDYKQYLAIGLDNLYDYFKGKSNNYDKFYDIVVPYYSYTQNYSEFGNCGYEINKIVCEYKFFEEYIEKCYFPDWLKILEPHLTKYVSIKSEMNMEEICLLTIISFALFKIKKADLKDFFGEKDEI